MQASTKIRALLITSALSTAFLATSAFAQAAQPAGQGADAGAGAGDSGLLSEVVITATRQVDTVSKVPLSITAVTQRSLDQQGVTQLTDLTRIVPSLQVSNGGAGGSVGQFAIRGISSSAGAAVTGVYLDDTPLTKRNANNIAGLNGSPAPPLFDLERVEVLRGPQGTLYGGSSEGGTIRFITPAPSVTRYSGFARAQLSQVGHGGTSYELGVAAGGPLVQDKLGFRASVMQRRNAGWVDAVDPYSGNVFAKDNNWFKQQVMRVSLLWKPTERSAITTSVYAANEVQNDDSGWTKDVPSAASLLSDPVLGPGLSALAAQGWGGLQTRCNAVPASPSARTSANAIACPPGLQNITTPGIYTGTNGARAYAYPAHPARAYDLKDYQSLRAGNGAYSPFRSYQEVASVTGDYDFGFSSLKVIASYFQDHQKGITYDTSVIAPLFAGYPYVLPEAPTWNTFNGGAFRPNNKRWGNTLEARLSSPAGQRLSWVIGYFNANVRATSHYNNIEDVETPSRIVAGLTSLQRYGAQLQNLEYATRYQNLKDTENAFFGEVNYNVTDEIKVTGGIRRSATSFTYKQVFWGTINGNYNPAAIPGGVTDGTVKETPISPKIGIQWQFTPDDQVYVTAAKGYRAGGVNSPLSEGQCGPALAELGLTVDQVPKTFDSDSIWSYEAGTKLRLFGNRLALNTAVYQIDWTGLQISVGPNRLGCGQQWIQNLGAARSRGMDLEAQFRVFTGFTVSLAGSYNKTEYTQDALGPTPTNPAIAPQRFATAGQSLGQQPYRINLQAQYNFKLLGNYDAYVRGDYTYTPQYVRTIPGQSGYSPDSSTTENTEIVNVRAGMTYQKLDVNVFINNLFESQDGTIGGGRSGCSTPACTSFTQFNPTPSINTFKPREFGIQATYRY
jgi:outer membrane receptor protein involved in Fe transport